MTFQAPSKPTSTFFAKVRNQSVFALGIVLIELWYARALRELGAITNIQEPDAGPEYNEMAEFSIAKRLSEEIYREAGDSMGTPSADAFFCEFDQTNTSLEINKVIEALLEPLSEHLKAFCGGTIEVAFKNSGLWEMKVCHLVHADHLVSNDVMSCCMRRLWLQLLFLHFFTLH